MQHELPVQIGGRFWSSLSLSDHYDKIYKPVHYTVLNQNQFKYVAYTQYSYSLAWTLKSWAFSEENISVCIPLLMKVTWRTFCQLVEKTCSFLKRKHSVRNQNTCRFISWLWAVSLWPHPWISLFSASPSGSRETESKQTNGRSGYGLRESHDLVPHWNHNERHDARWS